MKSIADSFIEEGVRKGVRQGELIGVKKGERTGIRKGERMGITKGERIGVKKGSSETAVIFVKRMIEEGIDDKTIRKITHLTQKNIDEIRSRIDK